MSPSTTPVPPAVSSAQSSYRFDHPGILDVLRDMYIRDGEPGPRDQVGPFELQTTDGGWLRSGDLPAQRRPVLLVFGSRTCPVMVSGLDGLKTLHARFGAHVRFVMVQVREAHPGAFIPQPKTSDRKLQHAIALQRFYQLPFEVAVDDIDGTFHRSLGGRPNSAYLISPSRTILFRAQWANETAAIGAALAAITAGESLRALTVTNTFQAILKSAGYTTTVLSAAGSGARLDFWKMALPMALMTIVSDLLFFLPREKRGLYAMVLLLSLTAGFAALGATFLAGK
ncbi:MAG: alkyl hydroperoxide reductase [Acidobacteria bacterium]|nr:alkyl hydroperoxide reductase [Acidobacteriota bacterium]